MCALQRGCDPFVRCAHQRQVEEVRANRGANVRRGIRRARPSSAELRRAGMLSSHKCKEPGLRCSGCRAPAGHDHRGHTRICNTMLRPVCGFCLNCCAYSTCLCLSTSAYREDSSRVYCQHMLIYNRAERAIPFSQGQAHSGLSTGVDSSPVLGSCVASSMLAYTLRCNSRPVDHLPAFVGRMGGPAPGPAVPPEV